MSRIGRMPITVPAGVEVKLDGATLTVKGKNGTLTQTFHPDMIIKVEAGVITVERPTENKNHKALHGLTRTLISNMVVGVTEGYKKELEINGVGYRAQKNGKKLVMTLGYSHPVEMEEPAGITFDVQENKITVSGADKQQVGQVAAEIRSKRPPEPYLGKGVKYVEEHIRRKSGKAGK